MKYKISGMFTCEVEAEDARTAQEKMLKKARDEGMQICIIDVEKGSKYV